MCGIAGIVSRRPLAPSIEELLKSMISKLHHRGPDGTGFYIDDHAGLAHARLSIIDLAGGDQPIHNETSSLQVIFNGEIFNYIELREDLIKRGHQFYTHSDTEVIVHLFEEYGQEFVHKLNGQFAIALWDLHEQALYLYRDRVGIAPLYYSQSGDSLKFASEIKALVPALDNREINLEALNQIFTSWSAKSPNSMLSGVYELPPGYMAKFHEGKLDIACYWDWEFPQSPDDFLTGNETQLSEELLHLLVDATNIRLRSDVPVGAYLSGGLDSSALVSIINTDHSDRLRTFSIGFDSQEHDESSFQQLLINKLNTQHSKINCSEQDIAENFYNTIWHTEAPILRTAPVPMRMLSGLVHDEGYKVVLTGEGADEVFGGYDLFKETKIRQFWAKHPNSSIRPTILKRLYPYLDVSPGRAQQYLQSFFGVDLDNPELPYFSHTPRWNTTSKCKDFFADDIKQAVSSDTIQSYASALPGQSANWHYFNRAQYLEAKTLMAGYLLSSQGDRMLMSNSVEGRFPFLDHRVIEFANKLHPNLKMKVLNEKHLLKKAVEKQVPKEIVNRYKQPYRAPDIPSFFKDGAPDYVDHLLSAEAIQKKWCIPPQKS